MATRFTITDAKRLKLKARIGLTGATNCGKTYSALLIAGGLLNAEGFVLKDGTPDWSKVGIIDTERKRALFYANNGVFGSFKHLDFQPPYHPRDYIEAVECLEQAGVEVIIIDSLTHAWSGTGGVLDIVNEKAANSKSKNTYTEGWGGKNGGTAIQNEMVDRILSSKCHIIATFRQKMDYTMDRDENGKTIITKVGLKPVQKDDLEYEFDITLKFNNDHTAEIIKNTVQFIQSEGTLDKITMDFGYQLGRYLSQGVDVETIKQAQLDNLKENIKLLVHQNPNLKDIYKIYTTQSINEVVDLDLLNQIFKAMKSC